VADHSMVAAPAVPRLDPDLRAQLQDLGPQMPALWASGRLTLVHQKELLRSLVRRVILTRPVADVVQVKIVWISGAVSQLTVQPPIWRTADLGDYEALVRRIGELSTEGYDDSAIAGQLRVEGFHPARGKTLDGGIVGKLRRKLGQPSRIEQYRTQAQIDGHWTVYGLARHLGVARHWVYQRIYTGRVPVERHPETGQYLLADDAALIAELRAEIESRLNV
jgi:hypothetical protein